ncbi:MAG: alpha/beta fold hydrolase [Hyphomicrobiales bacterium]|nr:alpha/beta fold hydrolase [Hyphomicrobiales bacterium]
MSAGDPETIEVGTGDRARTIAVLRTPARDAGAPGFVWLQGLKSEMVSTKASALDVWCREHGHACTRFDYSGHGRSGGRFEDATIGDWLEEAHAVIARLTEGPQVLVGSSTGGYIALLVLRDLLRAGGAAADRIRGLVLIAPAWDLTEALMWARFSEKARRDLMETGVYLRPSQYSPEPYPITRKFIEEGRRHLIGPEGFDPGRPIHVLHGLQDEDVPWEHTLDLVATLKGDHVTVEAVPDGDHRLARPEDLALLFEKLALFTR